MFSPALVCVCLSVTTITKKCGRICTKFYAKVPRGREDQVRVSLRSVEGCGSNGEKNSVNRRLFTK